MGLVRPEYESEADRDNERSIADAMATLWKCTFVKLKKHSPVDFAIERDGEIVAFAEVKQRDFLWWQFQNMGGVALSLHKAINMAVQAAATGLPHYFIVRAKDGIRYVRIERDTIREHPKRIFGTKRRGDPQDIEPCLFIPVESFREGPDDRPTKGD